MNKIKITIFTIPIIIFSSMIIKKLIYINQVKDLKNKEDLILNECLDLENKIKELLINQLN